MIDSSGFVCLGCGTTSGEAHLADDGTSVEDWYWNLYRYGRTGPFHSDECARAFRQMDQRFSLAEIRRMESIRQHRLADDRSPVVVLEFLSSVRREVPLAEPTPPATEIVWDWEPTFRPVRQ